MATVTRTYLVDDLDGNEGEETIQFNLDGTNWEIDLSADNAGRLREKIARFVAAASLVKAPKAAPAKRGTNSAVVKTNRQHVHEIREWAQAAGLDVSSRGRISKATQEAYEAAH